MPARHPAPPKAAGTPAASGATTPGALSPEIVGLRARFLSAVAALDPVAARTALAERLASEAREMHRLGNLAAQSWLVRQRLHSVLSDAPAATVADLIAATAEPGSKPASRALPGRGGATTAPPDGAASAQAMPPADAPATPPQPAPATGRWQRVRILQETEVNGLRFFEGTTVDVSPEDAERLRLAGSAEFLETSPPETATSTAEAADQLAPSSTEAKPAGRAKKPRKTAAKGS